MKTSMKKIVNRTVKTTLIATVASTAISGIAIAGTADNHGVKILEANFEPRQVVQVEAGDFHFKPGQVAPIHTHTAPAVGYVTKGEIIFQVEGEKQVLLREGDAFFEPVGPRILRFDNASATEEAIFIDFNLEQHGEPFIVFEKPPTENIDRRTLPTVKLSGNKVEKVDIFKRDLDPGESVKVNITKPALGIVAHGVVVIKQKGKPSQRVVSGGTFAIPNAGSNVSIANASGETSAKVITFRVL